ncbi:helix-turn-helix domain-containing protein [Cryptosporangium sp. NPDC051539]|uniref:helix-turn-helix domain-containing protein n=1 Tax=Cryptosporangium sp. NPDC051539 TaxID=3363962 RepID=UPI0037A9B7EA
MITGFIDEHLGDLRNLTSAKQAVLLETLSTYFRHLGSKTDTAAALRLQRQSLYQRLDKVFETIGEVPAGSDRLAGLLLAVEFERARRQLRR